MDFSFGLFPAFEAVFEPKKKWITDFLIDACQIANLPNFHSCNLVQEINTNESIDSIKKRYLECDSDIDKFLLLN